MNGHDDLPYHQELIVQSQIKMGGVINDNTRGIAPRLDDELIRCKSVQCFQPFCKIAGAQESVHMFLQLSAIFIVIAINRGFFDGSVHTFHLSICSGVVTFG